jgi:hypothetical protein
MIESVDLPKEQVQGELEVEAGGQLLSPENSWPTSSIYASPRQNRKYLFLAGVGFVGVVVVVTLILFNSETRQLSRGIAAKDYVSVNGFVDENLSDPEKQEAILFALRAAFDAHLDGVTKHFEELALSPKMDTSLKTRVFKEFISRRTGFANPAPLFDLLVKTGDSSANAPLILATFEISPLQQRRAIVAKYLPTSVETESFTSADHESFQRLLKLLQKPVPESYGDLESIRSQEEQAFTSESQLNDVGRTISSNEEEIASSQNQLAKKPFQITGYIVGQHSYGIYEFVPDYGRTHALLFASKTAFQTKGTFSLLVQEMGELPETLKEEYGGFTQMWKIYSECDDSCVARQDNLRNKIIDLRQQIVTAETQRASLSSTIAMTTDSLSKALSAFTTNSGAAPTESKTNTAAPEKHFTPEQLQGYYHTYERPEVKYLRTAFDSYLNGKGSYDEAALLSKWDKRYFGSKFIVTSINHGALGGTWIDIIFQQKPDAVFSTWVYGSPESAYQLRAFKSRGLSQQRMLEIQGDFRQFLEDKEHAM